MDTLAALVLSKLVIVAVLSLAAGALAGGTGSAPSGAPAPGGGFASVLGGAALLLLAAFAPWSLFRLLPFLEAGAVGHLEGLSQRARHQAMVPAKGLAATALRAAATGSMGAASGGVGVVGSVAAGAAGSPGAGAAGLQAGTTATAGDAGMPVDPYRPDDWEGPHPWEPGGSIMMMPPSPNSDYVMARFAATEAKYAPLYEAARRADEAEAARGGTSGTPAEPAVPAMPPGVTFVSKLPRATAERVPHYLGRDHLGPVLVSGHPRGDDPPS